MSKPLINAAASERPDGRSELDRHGTGPAERFAEYDLARVGQCLPNVHVQARGKSAGAISDEYRCHSHAAPAQREERARAAAVAKLHADAENKCAESDLPSDRGARADDRTAKE